MPRVAASITTLFLACTPLEERVPIVVGQWCDTDRSVDVACVVDGDTLDVGACTSSGSGGETIRLLGVAAPEIDHGGEGGECFGEEAKSFLDWAVGGRSVTLQFDTECTDIYQRTLAWLVLDVDEDDDLVPLLLELDELGLQEDGTHEVLVNELIIRAGYALVYDSDLSEDVRYGQRIEEAAEDAEADQRGLHASGACEDTD
jgi:endonuclease YncB( thermonuclease family)